MTFLGPPGAVLGPHCTPTAKWATFRGPQGPVHQDCLPDTLGKYGGLGWERDSGPRLAAPEGGGCQTPGPAVLVGGMSRQ